MGSRATRIAVLAVMALSAGAPWAHARAAEPLAGHVLDGVVENGQAGFDVAAVGDLDGDHVDDFVVGAPFGDAGKGASAGAAYLFYGPVDPAKSLLNEADTIFVGALPGDFAGEDLGAVGDLDGDGRDELLLGAPGSIPGIQPGAGRPGVGYLFHGRRERRQGTIVLEPGCLGTRTCDATFTGVHASDFFGFGLPNTPIGDTDGDGRDDLLIGSAGYGGYSGAAYLYYGERFTGEIAAGAADAVFVGPPAGLATRAMTGAGDLDGDGLGDFAIAAPGGLLSARPTPGWVYVYYGDRARRAGGSLMSEADAVLVGEPGARAGNGIAGGGDVDGDGLGDLLVGEPGLNAQGQRTPARAHLIHGSRERLAGTSRLGSVPGQAVLAGDPAGDELGYSTALGDLDGDGFAEAIAGAPSAAEGAGAVAVLRGKARRREDTIAVEAADRFLTGTAGEKAGAAVSAGHLDRDRAAELLVGAPAAKVGAPAAGAARVLPGRQVKPGEPGTTGASATAPGPRARDRSAPHMTVRAERLKRRQFAVSGRMEADGEACTGRVSVRLVSGRTTVARRTVPVQSDCRFRARLRPRAPRGRRLTPVAAFRGNAVLRGAIVRGRSVRA